MHRLRDENIAEGRILLACRSHDLTCVHRGQRSDHDCLRFHFAGESGDVLGTGEVEPEPETVATVPLAALDESEPEAAAAVPSAELDEPEPETAAAVTSAGPETPAGLPCGPHGVTGISIRFLHPKQRHHMAARSHGYTDWITVPSTPESPSTCWASRMYLYFRASEMMVQSDDLLFCTSRPDKKHDNKCWGLSADALANIMGRIMKEAGIPADFLPHSARHAGLALKKSQGMSDADVMACANMGQRTYVLHYMRQIRRRSALAKPWLGSAR